LITTKRMDALDYLLSLPRFADQGHAAYRPGLERMEALLAAMGMPHRTYPCVHIAGTNGKGSTASLLAAIARAAGYRVGLHTSPHLWHVGERMRIDGIPAPTTWLEKAVARCRPLFEQVQPSFFEATVALSFLYFAEQQVDLAVVEVGLGGRLDATNVVQPRLAVITSIGLDHTDILGETIEAIAREKAGIIKPGVPVLTGATQPEALAVIRETAARQQAPLHYLWEEVHLEQVEPEVACMRLTVRTPVRRYEDLEVGLLGRHQATNALLAIRAAELVLPEVLDDPRPIRQGLREVRQLSGLRGRFDVLQTRPLVVADVAHNPDGLAAVLATIDALHPPGTGRRYAIWSALRDKDAPTMAGQLVQAGFSVYVAALESPRAWSAVELVAMVQQVGGQVPGVGTVASGWQLLQKRLQADDVLLITGSHQVVAALPPVLWQSASVAGVGWCG
jgi:dihydrofolate synthase/folylpolyglutamate synthase